MMTRNRITNGLMVAVVAMACFALATSANAAITQTDAIGFPSEIGPIANDDLLQSNLTSVNATTPQYGSVAGINDGNGDDAADKFGYGEYSIGNAANPTATFVLTGPFNIGEIRVTAGSADGLRSAQDWDVYTSSNGGSTWDVLRMDNILLGSAVNGEGTTITLTDTTGTLASNVNAIKFDFFTAATKTYAANIQEIDVFEATPAATPGTLIYGK